jgi:hypothetical protein
VQDHPQLFAVHLHERVVLTLARMLVVRDLGELAVRGKSGAANEVVKLCLT